MKKSIILFALLSTLLSACYVDLEFDGEPNVYVEDVYEYEERIVYRSVYENGILIYEESETKAFMDITLRNNSLSTARDVTINVVLYDHGWRVSSNIISFGTIRSGDRRSVTFDTGLAYLSDYTNYEIQVNWH